MAKTVFQRHELKYIITKEQKNKVVEEILPYMKLDEYGKTTIRNLYFDTDNFRLIRRSIEKPKYKEKLRVRSYEKATDKSAVFVELKKKYIGEVFKRRIVLPESVAMNWLSNRSFTGEKTQIFNEIDYFLDFYENLHPTVFLSYEREAYYTREKSDFRVTFDENILCRSENLSLKEEAYGTPILDDEFSLMELKCSGGIPLWMTDILSREKIYKTSFSKYGTAYRELILPGIKEEKTNGKYKFELVV